MMRIIKILLFILIFLIIPSEICYFLIKKYNIPSDISLFLGQMIIFMYWGVSIYFKAYKYCGETQCSGFSEMTKEEKLEAEKELNILKWGDSGKPPSLIKRFLNIFKTKKCRVYSCPHCFVSYFVKPQENEESIFQILDFPMKLGHFVNDYTIDKCIKCGETNLYGGYITKRFGKVEIIND